jgi:hypothetical protein
MTNPSQKAVVIGHKTIFAVTLWARAGERVIAFERGKAGGKLQQVGLFFYPVNIYSHFPLSPFL